MITTVTVDYDCCNATYVVPTAIPAMGSALLHSAAVDTVALLVDVQHSVDHPECKCSEAT